jgi:hypothetical protein
MAVDGWGLESRLQWSLVSIEAAGCPKIESVSFAMRFKF